MNLQVLLIKKQVKKIFKKEKKNWNRNLIINKTRFKNNGMMILITKLINIVKG